MKYNYSENSRCFDRERKNECHFNGGSFTYFFSKYKVFEIRFIDFNLVLLTQSSCWKFIYSENSMCPAVLKFGKCKVPRSISFYLSTFNFLQNSVLQILRSLWKSSDISSFCRAPWKKHFWRKCLMLLVSPLHIGF